jgi:phage-related protein
MAAKQLAWVGTALDDLRRFPEEARRLAGFELRRLQHGLDPTDWKPITSVGLGVREIRLHTGVEHRVFYVAKFGEAIYVLHAFEKRTRQTAQADLDLGERRYRELVRWRREER